MRISSITANDDYAAASMPLTPAGLPMSIHASPSLADCLRRRRDNFLLLRLAAAVLVVFGHSYAAAHIPGVRDFIAAKAWGPGVYTGSVAVEIFFVVSGFLVTGSYVNRHDLRFFVRARFLRIVPAYLVCVVGCAYVIGPMVTRLPLGEYLQHGDTIGYVLKNMTFTQLDWYLPGVFESNPNPRVVNGSLWTLPAEVRMYALVALFGLLGLLQRRRLFNVVIGATFVWAAWFPETAMSLWAVDAYFRLAGLFALGAVFYVNREHIPVNGYLSAALIAFAWLLHGTSHFMAIYGLALGYGSLWFAYAPRLDAFNRFGDYSYGVYLWGFPVEQLVAMALGRPTPMQVFAWAMPLTLLVAIGSWHLIEKPALALKNTPLHGWPRALFGRAAVPASEPTSA